MSSALIAAQPATSVLVAGLGAGFSLEVALDFPGVEHVTVVELHDVVIEWNRTFFGDPMAPRLADRRLTIVCDDVTRWIERDEAQFDAICLDVDNGPDWLSTPSNRAGANRAGAGFERALCPFAAAHSSWPQPCA